MWTLVHGVELHGPLAHVLVFRLQVDEVPHSEGDQRLHHFAADRSDGRRSGCVAECLSAEEPWSGVPSVFGKRPRCRADVPQLLAAVCTLLLQGVWRTGVAEKARKQRGNFRDEERWEQTSKEARLICWKLL